MKNIIKEYEYSSDEYRNDTFYDFARRFGGDAYYPTDLDDVTRHLKNLDDAFRTVSDICDGYLEYKKTDPKYNERRQLVLGAYHGLIDNIYNYATLCGEIAVDNASYIYDNMQNLSQATVLKKYGNTSTKYNKIQKLNKIKSNIVKLSSKLRSMKFLG